MIGHWVIYQNYIIDAALIHLSVGVLEDSLIRSTLLVEPSSDVMYSGEVVFNDTTQMFEIHCTDINFTSDYAAIDLVLDAFKVNYLRSEIQIED